MIAVLFEAVASDAHTHEYFDLAGQLRPLLDEIDGFISIERFESITTPGKVLSLSFWRDEEAIQAWRRTVAHRKAQAVGRHHVFDDYRLRIAHVVRDYGLNDRTEAPDDSREAHGEHG
ncbi:antibiotic biosynthesis monooxygenase family protein [Gimibacter soli]|uniref:Antibiotic biosynthesis monooxygenase n=1 Tax=Gimibacter soli TaxID=3024400 RepID=A0AAE9XPE2_9PROT|nr:antibiotic biosynthesis monooxygenase [Gimibacter soli]WCL54732.1 antibiotic biosynthesis monooxygenase [Gimibacter soli]